MTEVGGDAQAADSRAAAEARVADFLATLGRLGPDDLMRTALARADDPARDAARIEAERQAGDAGLGDVLTAARAAVRDRVLRVFDDALYRPTMVGLNWGLSEGTTEDRVATIRACEDAVTAVVVEPLVSEATLRTLDSPFELIDRGRDVDTAFDLTRATADAVEGRRPGSRLGAAFVIGLAILGGAAVIGGSWPIALASVIAIGALAVALRARSRSDAR